MNILCKSKINCDEPNRPTSDFNAEAPDSEVFLSRFQMFQPPALGSNFTNSMNTGFCEGKTQDEADSCAEEDFMRQVAANNSAPPVCLLPVPPDVPCDDDSALFKNSAQTCFGICPDGLPFAFTVPAGRFTAFSQSVADLFAHSFACNQILENRVCIGSLPTAEACVGAFFSATVNCTANFAPLTFSAFKPFLPPGLSVSSAGPLSFKLSGTPTTVGNYSFTIRAVDQHGNFMDKRFQLAVVGISSTTLTPGTVGVAYSVQLSLVGSTHGSVAWTVLSGSLPSGLSLSASGLISGTPTAVGTSSLTLGFSDDNLTCRTNASLAVASGAPTCVAAAGTLPINPTAELAMSSTNAIRRMLSTSFGGGGTADVINTATGAVVLHFTTIFDMGWPVFAPSNNTFWIQALNTDALKKHDSNGVLLATVTPAPGSSFNAPMSYEPNTGKIYAIPSQANYIIYEINPATNAVVVGLNLGVGGGFFAVFSTPGKLFVAGIPPVGSGSIFDIYSVPGYAHIGSFNTAVPQNQQAFTYASSTGKAYISAIVAGHDEIWEINPATAVVDHAYDLTGITSGISSMAYDSVNNRIFVVDLLNGVGVVIDPTNRTIICQLATPFFGFAYDSLVCDPVSGIFYFSDNVNGNISKWT